jgi:hypothetical protein
MGGPDKRAKPLTFQELTELRRKTEAVSKFLQDQLAAHLETLRPVLSPERVFSKFLGTKGDHVLADRAFAQLQQNYRPFSGRPFDIPSEFDPQWLTLVGNRLALYPWEYAHEARTDRETKTITMASPVRWAAKSTWRGRRSVFRQPSSCVTSYVILRFPRCAETTRPRTARFRFVMSHRRIVGRNAPCYEREQAAR